MNNAYIIVEEDGRQINNINLEIDDPVTIGRDDENKVVLPSSKVSRFHCVISYEGNEWLVNDLHSTNGIWINENKCASASLSDGDVIKIQPFTLKIHIPSSGNDTLSDQTQDNSIIQDETQTDDSDKTVISTAARSGDATFVEDDMTVSPDRKMQRFLIVTVGIDEGASVPLNKRIIIGRAETCDLILTDSAISRNHIEVQRDKGRYYFKNLSHGNVVLCNGKIKESGVLADGDTLKVGNTELVVRLEKENNVGGRKKWKKSYLVALPILFVLLLVILGSFFKGHKNETTKESTLLEEDAVTASGDTLDRKKQLALLKREAEMFASTGQYNKAINRLEAYLQIVPDDKLVLQAVDEYKGKSAIEEKKKAEMLVAENEYKQKAETELAKASEFLARKDYAGTIEILNKLSENKVTYSSSAEILKRGEAIRLKVKEAQEKQSTQQDLEKKNFQTAYEEIKYAFESGEKAFNEKKFVQAKKAWEKAAASTMDVNEKTQAIARLKNLEDLFREKIEENYSKGQSAVKNKDYKNTLKYWSSVIEMYPDFRGIKSEYDTILAAQIEKSRHFYQTGLVYEGLNNLDNAILNWQKALDELPVENSEYNRKASAKLGEYGK